MRIGLDIGSTTIKAVGLDDGGNIIYERYERHLSRITEKVEELLGDIADRFPGKRAQLCVSGSAAMGFAESCSLPFVQEVYATKVAASHLAPDTDVVIELGGEDAKMLFLTGGELEVRMNGSCAGGTGAFIDQMAALLGLSLEQMNEAAFNYEKLYTIASRCGVFAKSDIQPLINQGASKADLSASILAAVVNQTISGLAQGRRIEGNVLYLGGPLTFMSALRESFDRILGIKGNITDGSLYYVAYGAAMLCDSDRSYDLEQLARQAGAYTEGDTYASLDPLFETREEYDEFAARHALSAVPEKHDGSYGGALWLGIDAGSTTVKAVACDSDGCVRFHRYLPGDGNAVASVRQFLGELYEEYPNARIAAAAVTGYGEELIRQAFRIDYGVVETIAHFTAAKAFRPDVDFIIDIGGQDIKCFKIHEGTIDNLYLNEACSSGCGSFLLTFAGALGMKMEDFAACGLFAPKPVDLGSRCTVFMNSSVKQAQKDGAGVENISAGLSISVVKNALYKVIRATGPDDLGENIVVQGGTFMSDAVLRAFEKETGRKVIRPNLAGLMGAYGAALFCRDKALRSGADEAAVTSAVLSRKELDEFKHEVRHTVCKGCENHCSLTVNIFDGGRRSIGGNRCQRALGQENAHGERLSLYQYKNELLRSYKSLTEGGTRGKIGLPMGLNILELYPFWHTFFTKLGYEVVPSSASTRDTYLRGHTTIPSDTVCYPAKLLHGHVLELAEMGVDAVFYPCMSYATDEGKGDNHYNCPVVAYYPEVIGKNVPLPEHVRFIGDYVGLHIPKALPGHLYEILRRHFGDGAPSKSEIKSACKAAYAEYESFRENVRAKGAEYLARAKAEGRRVIILAGRPYHEDGEINHGIDNLLCDMGAVVLSEDAVAPEVGRFRTKVLNQWTFHARLFAAAKYVADLADDDINFVQLVSFGCGVDAITTDEARRILERCGKIYTQIKIDDITNLGAVRIRLRSLFEALDERRDTENMPSAARKAAAEKTAKTVASE